MSAADKQIETILARYEEPIAGNIWRVQGHAVIYHKTLERIAVRAQVDFDQPKILRAERDEAVVLVTGRMGERTEWSIGEALVGVNYRVSGKQAAYVYAMAEKRAKDRVILKLIELHGLVYSEEEAEEFRAPPAADEDDLPAESQDEDQGSQIVRALADAIDRKQSASAIVELMQSAPVKGDLQQLDQDTRDWVRNHAAARMRALGWQQREQA